MVVLVFGLIQILIGARLVLLLLDAREANGLVAAILRPGGDRQRGIEDAPS